MRITYRLVTTCVLAILLIAVPRDSAGVEEKMTAAMHLEKAVQQVKAGDLFLAIEEYRQAIRNGLDTADIQQELAVLLYYQGFVGEAAEALQRALAEKGTSAYLHHKLAVCYFAMDHRPEALQHFRRALELNPGSGDSLYYLSHLLYRMGEPDAARLFAKAARQLGHAATDLVQLLKLEDLSGERDLWASGQEVIYLRRIIVATPAEADEIVSRIAAGEQFEQLAYDRSEGPNADQGGYAGGIPLPDLQPAIRDLLRNQPPFHAPLAIDTTNGINIIQRITPVDWPYIETLLIGNHDHEPVQTGESREQRGAAPYLILAGAFHEQEHADERLDRLTKLGFRGHIGQERSSGTDWYVVVAGEFTDRQSAAAALIILQSSGIEAYISERR